MKADGIGLAAVETRRYNGRQKKQETDDRRLEKRRGKDLTWETRSLSDGRTG